LKRSALIVLLVVVTAGGCSDDDRDEATPERTTTTGADGASTTVDDTCSPTDGTQVAADAKDFAFAPACIQVRVDQELKVTNTGSATHNVTVKPAYDQDIEPTQSFVTDVGGGLQPGTYELYCKFHQGRGMTARLEVVAT
jgi:plastocyanin